MKRIVLSLIAGLIICGPALGWGREGHETIAKIAEGHLKPSVKKKVEKYLGGKSIVYFAKWMDDYRHIKGSVRYLVIYCGIKSHTLL